MDDYQDFVKNFFLSHHSYRNEYSLFSERKKNTLFLGLLCQLYFQKFYIVFEDMLVQKWYLLQRQMCSYSFHANRFGLNFPRFKMCPSKSFWLFSSKVLVHKKKTFLGEGQHLLFLKYFWVEIVEFWPKLIIFKIFTKTTIVKHISIFFFKEFDRKTIFHFE
jgi:hypothetical protein